MRWVVAVFLTLLCGSALADGYRYGVNLTGTEVHSDREFDLLAQTGVKWARISLPWMAISHAEGKYDWTVPDHNIAALRKRDINVLLILTGTPCWADSKSETNASECVKDIPKLSALQDYVTKAIARYHSDVNYWEIWNEPDIGLNGSLKDYRQDILLPASRILHLKGMHVVAPALSSDRFSPSDFQRNLGTVLNGGGAGAIDIVSVHVYRTADRVVPYGRAAKSAMTQYGIGNKPIWLTEFGNKLGHSAITAPAGYLRSATSDNRTGRVFAKMFWFSLRDGKCSPSGDCSSMSFGLLDNDLNPRPSFEALRTQVGLP